MPPLARDNAALGAEENELCRSNKSVRNESYREMGIFNPHAP